MSFLIILISVIFLFYFVTFLDCKAHLIITLWKMCYTNLIAINNNKLLLLLLLLLLLIIIIIIIFPPVYKGAAMSIPDTRYHRYWALKNFDTCDKYRLFR